MRRPVCWMKPNGNSARCRRPIRIRLLSASYSRVFRRCAADGSSAVTHQHESRPIKRMTGLRIPHQLQRRLPQGFSPGFMTCIEGTMKAHHEISRAGGFDLPLADDGRGYAGNKQRPRQTDHALARAEPSARGFTGGQYGEFGLEIELHQFPRFEHTVFVLVSL